MQLFVRKITQGRELIREEDYFAVRKVVGRPELVLLAPGTLLELDKLPRRWPLREIMARESRAGFL
jgi:hypothetical protein